MAELIFTSPLFFQAILPFLLVFVLVFAVLSKSEILGKGKNQVNALVALVIGLIVISFGYAVYIINNLIPFMAVALVVILVFMILVGAIFEPGKFELHAGIKWAFIGIIAIAVLIATLYFTGAWEYLYDLFYSGGTSSNVIMNAIFIILVIVAVAVVVMGGKSGGSSSSEKKG